MLIELTLGLVLTLRAERTLSEPALTAVETVTKKGSVASSVIRLMVDMRTILNKAYKVDFK